MPGATELQRLRQFADTLVGRLFLCDEGTSGEAQGAL
jgi:hypothetical protein